MDGLPIGMANYTMAPWGTGTSDGKLSWNVRLELDDKFDLYNLTHT